ncbi:hypothetical protein A0123_00464 [Gluconobacter cerinus]|uniref:Uncharacterized protein n=1 Tax=Gluconobacter cerinus TaxID=38307 RepID=A0A1B6VPJ6_9PROT|nr:hypothetical protein A0123_00464 [Gluconobacter cerinus]
MDEDVLAAGVRRDEAEALGGIVPLHGAADILCVGQVRSRTARTCRRSTKACLRSCAELRARARSFSGAFVNGNDFSNLATLRTLANANNHGCTRIDAAYASIAKSVGVQEDIARAVSQFNETETLFGVEPLNAGADFWAGSGNEAAASATTRCAEATTTATEAATVAAAEAATIAAAEAATVTIGWLGRIVPVKPAAREVS